MNDKPFEGMTDADKLRTLRRELTLMQGRIQQLGGMIHEMNRGLSDRLAALEKSLGIS